MVSRASYLCLMLKGEQNTNYDWWDGIAQWLHSRFQTSFPGFEPDCWKNEFIISVSLPFNNCSAIAHLEKANNTS